MVLIIPILGGVFGIIALGGFSGLTYYCITDCDDDYVYQDYDYSGKYTDIDSECD